MLLSLMTVLFVGLKLTGFIDWSWWLVVAPTIVHASFSVFILFVVAAFGIKVRTIK